MTETMLRCRNVWKLYGRGAQRLLDRGAIPSLIKLRAANLVPAVCGIDLHVNRGEIFVIMGLSGSGKSTLVRCMSRLIEPTKGELLFDGRDLRDMSAREMINVRRHRMGMVFQHFALLPHLSVLDNVAFPLDIQGQSKPQRELRAREVIELVGLSGREHDLPKQLSGGQQQRVGIARSLAVEPEIWFLDEPFSALDPLIRREMQDEFLRLQDKLRTTIVFITHDFDEAIRLADRIAIMKDGAITQIATPEQLVLNPADDYVREFVRYIPREKVITVRSIMSGCTPESGAENGTVREGATVRASQTVAEVARLVLDQAAPLQVLGDDDEVLGALDRDTVAEFLVRGMLQ